MPDSQLNSHYCYKKKIRQEFSSINTNLTKQEIIDVILIYSYYKRPSTISRGKKPLTSKIT